MAAASVIPKRETDRLPPHPNIVEDGRKLQKLRVSAWPIEPSNNSDQYLHGLPRTLPINIPR